GGNGRTGPIASKNCAVVACQSSMQRSPPVRRRGSGACPDTRRSNKLCATTTSTHSVSPDSMSLPKLNPVEPPWYGPVCPVVGEGWHREVSPYPDQCALWCVRRSWRVPAGGRPARVRPSGPPDSECCVAVGDGDCEAYTAIRWGVRLSLEIHKIAE